ncbi:sigma factor [Bacillus chungangensis]|uniref:DNA-directed RNA polymerase specialized sigma24 family protein n=1 Tax=Bacillus chungangensis TaxID=587633 RepID=A0ABT9WQ69_9BACI|nr:sigma factor [Bacillus chungangensis]MDQ0175434.1 DNA-directed RNA polymerase specialized sigma24 family protein [Bacillus chungangensis]
MKINEQNVVQQLKKRNKKALYYIIDHNGGLITSIIRTHLYDLEAVHDDCMDDILLTIWDQIDTFCPENNTFKNWVATVAKYKAIEYQKKYSKHYLSNIMC